MEKLYFSDIYPSKFLVTNKPGMKRIAMNLRTIARDQLDDLVVTIMNFTHNEICQKNRIKWEENKND